MDNASLYPILLSVSIILQITAVFVAYRMIPLFERPWGWAMTAVAFSLIAVRRIVILIGYFSDELAVPAPLGPTSVSLGVSVFLLIGVLLLKEQLSRSEGERRQSQRRYGRIVDNVREGIWLTDSSGATVFTNASLREMLGYTLEELTGQPIEDFFFEPSAILNSAGQEICFRHSNGQPFWAGLHSTEFAVEDTEEPGTLHVLTDTNELRESTALLHEREQYFRALTERSSDIVFIIDKDGLVQYASPALTIGFGYSIDELVGHSLTEFAHPDDVERVKKKFRAVRESSPNSITRAVYRFRRNDGTWRHVEGQMKNLMDDPLIQGIVLNARDITYRMITQMHLQTNAHQQALVARMGLVALSSIDLREFMDRLTSEIASLMHVPFAKVMLLESGGKELRLAAGVGWSGDLVGKALMPTNDRSLAAYTLEIGQPVVVEDLEEESRFLDPPVLSGHDWRSAISCVIRGPERVYGILAVHSGDVRRFSSDDAYFVQSLANLLGEKATSIDHSEALRLNEERSRSSQRLEALGQLAGGIAHDFNNLLTGILGYSDLLTDRLRGNPRATRELDEIKKAANRAADLTRQILAFGRKQLLRKRAFDLNTQIDDHLNMLRRVIGERVSTRFEAGTGELWIEADATQIDLTVLNLCVNARDAIDGDGEILIETDRITISPGKLHRDYAVNDGNYVRLRVSDTGSGIPDEVMPRIFEPFYTTKPDTLGTGLGLATVYGIVKQHNGHIFAFNQDTGGATFEILLPEVVAVAKAPVQTVAPESQGNGETILLAEDDECIAEVCGEMLEQAGYSVLYAANGSEAVDLFKNREVKPDLLIFDVMMPQKDGVQAMNEIHEINPGVPCLLCSGYPSDALTEDILRRPLVAFIAKPYNQRTLIEKASELIESAHG